MKIKEILLKGGFIALAVALIPVTAVSAPKVSPGSACKVLNKKVVYQNKTFTGTQSGKKLTWNKGVGVGVAVGVGAGFSTATPFFQVSFLPD